MKGAALVLFSGGQDSTTCLAWALDKFERVETIGFDYGQRHRIELGVRPRVLARMRKDFPDWSGRLGQDHLIDIKVLGQVSETALTRGVEIAMQENGLPNTFVPGRNLLFLAFAAAVAYRRSAKHLVMGVCETDYSGYPDCRDERHQGDATRLEPWDGDTLCHPHSVDVDRQGADLGAGGAPGKRGSCSANSPSSIVARRTSLHRQVELVVSS